jgi:hypothetical protein
MSQIYAEAFAAEAAGDNDNAVAKLKEAAAIEDSIDDLSQPPYPPIPAAADPQSSQAHLWAGECGGSTGRHRDGRKTLRRILGDLENC